MSGARSAHPGRQGEPVGRRRTSSAARQVGFAPLRLLRQLPRAVLPRRWPAAMRRRHGRLHEVAGSILGLNEKDKALNVTLSEP